MIFTLLCIKEFVKNFPFVNKNNPIEKTPKEDHTEDPIDGKEKAPTEDPTKDNTEGA